MVFFALMGGFIDEEGQRLYLNEKGKFYSLNVNVRGEDHVLDEPHFFDLGLVDADIQDKSKSGFLSKGFAVLQTSWFVLQCVARGVERLPIIELEITTFAFAALNLAVYVLWWNKPLAVERPIRVHKWKPSNDTPTNQPTAVSLLAKILDRPPMKQLVKRVEEAQKWSTERLGKAQRDAVGDQIRFLDRWLVNKWILPFAGPVFEMIGLPLPSRDGSLKHYNFYAGEVKTEQMIGDLPYIAPAAGWVAAIFGAIHCVAWWFQFPSVTEQKLWRFCAAVITCTPLFYLVLGFIVLVIYLFPERPSDRQGLHNILMSVFTFVVALPGVLYFLSRLILVALALASLRSLPPGAFQTVSWANFIPHI
jgi:hypothetical protein